MTIPHGPKGKKIILDFEGVPERPRTTSRGRYILSAGLLISCGFFAMAVLIKPVIPHEQVADKGAPQKAVDPTTNQGSDAKVTSAEQGESDSTVIRNGVTVVTPHLLVPVVSDAAATEESAALSKPEAVKTRTARPSTRTAKHTPLSAPWFNPTKQVVRY